MHTLIRLRLSCTQSPVQRQFKKFKIYVIQHYILYIKLTDIALLWFETKNWSLWRHTTHVETFQKKKRKQDLQEIFDSVSIKAFQSIHQCNVIMVLSQRSCVSSWEWRTAVHWTHSDRHCWERNRAKTYSCVQNNSSASNALQHIEFLTAASLLKHTNSYESSIVYS